MWWVLFCTALFLFFSVYFPWISRVIVAGSGCDVNATGCGGLKSLLEGVVRPLGYLGAGALLLVATVARIRYANLSLLWLFFFAIWFMASGVFLTNAGNMWMLQGAMSALMEATPPELFYLAVFTLYLCFPLEEYDGPGNPILAGIQVLTALVACWATMLSFISVENLAQRSYALTGSQQLMEMLVLAQNWVTAFVIASGAAVVPHVYLFSLFLVLIGVQAILRTRPAPVRG